MIANPVTNESALLVEPTAVVTQGLLKVQPARGAKVLIIGDGTIGLIAARVVHAWNASAVHMVGLKEGQADLAKQAGVDLFMTTSPIDKYDLKIDASGRVREFLKQSDNLFAAVRSSSLVSLVQKLRLRYPLTTSSTAISLLPLRLGIRERRGK